MSKKDKLETCKPCPLPCQNTLNPRKSLNHDIKVAVLRKIVSDLGKTGNFFLYNTVKKSNIMLNNDTVSFENWAKMATCQIVQTLINTAPLEAVSSGCTMSDFADLFQTSFFFL